MTRHWADVYVEELRSEAERMKVFGHDQTATMLNEIAREIDARRAAYEDEELSAAQAAEESGYTPTRIRELRKERLWSGRRRDLPRKPQIETPRPRDLGGDARREADGQLSIAERVLRNQNGRESRRRITR